MQPLMHPKLSLLNLESEATIKASQIGRLNFLQFILHLNIKRLFFIFVGGV